MSLTRQVSLFLLEKSHANVTRYPGITRVNNQSSKTVWTPRAYTRPQIRSGWNSEQSACVVLNVESNKLTLIVILATDVILLSTMFVGLLRLRLRCRGGETFELGRLLWKQVRLWRLFPTVVFLIYSLLKGLIWLLIGTAAELTPVVSLARFILRPLCAHDSFTLQLFVSLYLKGSFLFPNLPMNNAYIDRTCSNYQVP